MCGELGCAHLLIYSTISAVVVLYVYPVSLYRWRRWIRKRAAERYKREGGTDQDYIDALMEGYDDDDNRY